MHYQFQRRSNYLTIPLIIIASSTGLTSVAQVALSSRALSIVTAASGAISATLAAVQRYYRYSERAEQCKSLAKSYGIIGTKLETRQAMHCIQTLSGYSDIMELMKFAEEMRQGMEQLMKDTDDAPMGFMTKETMYIAPESYNQSIGGIVRTFSPPKQIFYGEMRTPSDSDEERGTHGVRSYPIEEWSRAASTMGMRTSEYSQKDLRIPH
jgi:hypothetical protein